MRVLLITTMYPSRLRPYSGIFVKRQVEVLREMGIEVILAKAEDRNQPRNHLQYYSELLWQSLKASRQSFDLVHVHYPVLAGLLGSWVARIRRRPLVFTFHGGEVDRNSLKFKPPTTQFLTNLIVKNVIKRADAVVIVSQYLANILADHGAHTEKIHIINMGVDTNLFHQQDKIATRKYLGIPANLACVVCVANFNPQKGQEHVIRAASYLCYHDPSIHWYFVGEGPLEKPCKELSRNLGIQDLIHFCGPRPPEEIPRWDAAADIVVVPSTAEAFGLAALEAMACGTPVVASNVGGLPDFIQDGENGYLIPPASSEAIAEKVRQLLEHPELRRKIGQNGIVTAMRHELRLQAQKIIRIYESLIT
jgi:glycosyltransferase involved in cell wall biosynthesis